VITRLVVAFVLIGHGAVHAGFVSPRPPATATGPTWPFDLDRSRILGFAGLDAARSRQVGTALTAVTLVAFLLAAIAALGFFPAGVWVASIAIGSMASICLLVLYFRRWLVLGVVIDVVLLWATLVQGWTAGDLS
jgi:hypothetical protein